MTEGELAELAEMHAAGVGVLDHRTPTPQESVLWVEACADLPFRAVRQALEQLLRASRRMPAPFEVREVAVRLAVVAPTLRLPGPDETRNRRPALAGMVAAMNRDPAALEEAISRMEFDHAADRAEWERTLERCRENLALLGPRKDKPGDLVRKTLTK